jgi:hypothetical protein
MLVLLPVLLTLAGSATLAVISFRSVQRRRHPLAAVQVPTTSAHAAALAVRGMWLRMLGAIGAGLVAYGVVAFAPVHALRLDLGGAIAPGIGALVACLVIAIWPFPRAGATSGIRHAELVRRNPSLFGPRWGFILPLASAGILVAFLLATASLSSTDNYSGLSRNIAATTEAGHRSISPYPGWFYVVPILVVIVLLSAGVLFALRRVSGAPQLAPVDLIELDRAIRRSFTRFVMLLSSAVIVLYLGGVSVIAGEGQRELWQWTKPSGEFLKVLEKASKNGGIPSRAGNANDYISGVVQPQYTASAIEAVLGIVLILFAISLVILAIASLSLKWTAVAATDIELTKVDA